MGVSELGHQHAELFTLPFEFGTVLAVQDHGFLYRFPAQAGGDLADGDPGAGAVEAVMTMEEVNDRTETENEAPNQQLFALSIGNAVGAIYGTIGGGANIPMSVLNLEAGANGRFRISGIIAGLTVFIFVMVAAPLIAIITTSSLIGLMVAVILATMDWGSIWLVLLALVPQSCRDHPRWVGLAKTYPSMTILELAELCRTDSTGEAS